jgi:hypothetical protein
VVEKQIATSHTSDFICSKNRVLVKSVKVRRMSAYSRGGTSSSSTAAELLLLLLLLTA